MEGSDRKMDILLVEDNPGDIRLTQEAMRESGLPITLHVVKDGVQAIEFLEQEGAHEGVPRPDLILLDLNLPRMNGKEVLAYVKSNPELETIPIVILTTSSNDDDIRKCYTLQANCYVLKPIDFERFIGLVRSIESFWLELAALPQAADTT